jgi:hypothetical protein
MAVASRGAALKAFRELINHEQVQAKTILRDPYLPDDLTLSDDPFAMDPTTLIGGYGNEARYTVGPADPEIRRAIARAPAAVLSGRPSIRHDTIAAYAKTSLDLTMEGGTTSGVVYPLAVCELASNFRFRNVGGASAGAIAAALTAAAELGRSSQVLPADEGGRPPDTGEGFSTNGSQIRAGFTGMADIISWLAQTRPGDDQKTDQYRLAQLFRPGRSTAAIFRVAIALMRGQSWPLPLLALFAFGWAPRLFTLALIAGAIVLTGYLEWKFTGLPRSVLEMIGSGALGVLGFVATIVAIVLLLQVIRAIRLRQSITQPAGGDRLQELQRYTSAYLTPRSHILRQLIIAALVIILVVLVAILWWPLYAAGLLVGFAGSLIIAIGLSVSVLIYINGFEREAFGLVAGMSPQRQRNLLDVMAAVPKPTVEKSLVPWLNDCLTALAGLPQDQVLRFGHLWSGWDYHIKRLAPSTVDQEKWEQMSIAVDHRLINLELMTTDLTRQRPFRFPLEATTPDDPEQLWVCVDDLREGDSQIFPDTILDALSATERRTVKDHHGVARTLQKLPQPWDLPVIFAVRISMSLPLLFKAVPMYRIRESSRIQDDFGHDIHDQGQPLTLISPLDSAQELWFSDGGITSNFPVHFFDNALPRWPTVSLNLGTHPVDAPHQDVWLPEDWENLKIPVKTLGSSGLGFGKAIFNTAMSWRDSLQSALPGYRNRIGQVRTSPGEGGSNLFMPREIIASLALRGALAGARLRTRFSNDKQWDRFRWLRLRTALSDLEHLRGSTFQRRGFYADVLAAETWLDIQEAEFCQKPCDIPIDWYRPDHGFWPKAARFLNTVADAYRPSNDPVNIMTSRAPRPEPVLRQVPKE